MKTLKIIQFLVQEISSTLLKLGEIADTVIFEK